ncbi:trigger factor [uncultured Mailhella sp.]|uniref:trigger factor n=1 Tax=uncultured Mailhella sp. TaxID=1981031 RepID=UPI0025FF6F81|nr:trigger factor [uncultured Mailhella sp.]
MAHSIEVVSPVSRKISVTVPAEEVNAALSAAAREVGASVTLPGFRKGKAPASVIEKRFAGEVISRATETLVERRVADILKEEDLKPLSRLDYEGGQITRGQDLSFSFSFETLPDDIKLPEDLSALTVEMDSSEATEEELAAFTNRLLKSTATLEEVKEARLPENGDIVTIDVDGEVDGKSVPGMKVENYSIQLSEPAEGKELSELDKIIRGLHAGEEGTGSMVCPEDHVDETLRGKTVNLRVKLNRISREILPELNDDYAKKLGFPDLDALKKMIADQANHNKLTNARSEAERKLMTSVLEGQTFPLPEAVVKAQQEEYENEVREYLSQQGLEKEAVDETVKNMAEDSRKQAEERARIQLFLTALARREKIEVTAQEVDMQIMQMAHQYKQDFHKLREALYQNGAVNDIQDRMVNSKAMNLMFDKAQKVAPAAEAKAE